MKKLSLSLALAAALMLNSIPLSATTDFNLPDLGDSSVGVISPSEEVVIGKKFMQQARGSLAYITDPEVEAYLAALGHSLTKNLSNNNVDFQFYIVNQSIINAFAVPGGHITMFSGLIAASENENELASVVAHEITHVTQKHLPRMIAQSQQSTIPTAAAVIGGILLGGQAGAAAIVSASAAAIENQLTYSRAFESEADSIGMQLMVKSGFDPNGMTGFFNILQSSSRIGDSKAPEYLRTHPLTLTRVTEAQLRAQRATPISRASSDEYFFMREKIRAYTPNIDKKRLVENFAGRLNNNATPIDAVRFGYSYALMNAKDYENAHKQAKLLLESNPNNPYFHNLQAQIFTDQGQYTAAKEVMTAVIKQFPNNRALQKDYADILVKAGDYQNALVVINPLLEYKATNAYLYDMAAKAYGATGDQFNTHLHLADFFALRGGYDIALQHLDSANNFVDGSYFNQTMVDTKRRLINNEKNVMANAKF